MIESLCRCCGLAMAGGPSMGGVDLCSWCDMGVSRDGVKWDLKTTMLMIGRGSVFGHPCNATLGCTRYDGHPGTCI